MKIKQGHQSTPRIETLPLIDIVFLLLVFFIYAMLSMAVHHGQQVDLPHSTSVALETNEAISVTIQSLESEVAIYVNKKSVNLLFLRKELRKIAPVHQEVRIFADKGIPYQDLFRVLDAIRAAGFSRLSLQAISEGEGS